MSLGDDRLHERARVRSPHADGANADVLSTNVTEPSSGGGSEPMLVTGPVERAGDDAERVVGQAHDREVGSEPAAGVEQAAFTRTAGGHVAVVDREATGG
jgi:hypothetical protein